MYDGLKLEASISDLSTMSQLLEWESHSVDPLSGEVYQNVFFTTKHKGLKFKYSPLSQRLEVNGSIHKYFNDGIDNSDLFTLNKFKIAELKLQDLLNVCSKKVAVHSLEFGVNIQSRFPAQRVVDSLLLHGTKGITTEKKFQKGSYKEFEKQRKIIKCYNKSVKELDQFRYEVKFRKMCDVVSHGRLTLDDLKSKHQCASLGQKILKEWSYLLLYDWTIDWDSTTNYVRKTKQYQWKLAKHWCELSVSQRSNEKSKYHELVRDNSQDVKSQLRKEIVDVLTACIES
jgi:hypothetical protein